VKGYVVIGIFSPLFNKVMGDSTAAIQSEDSTKLTSGFNNILLKCAQQNCMDCTDTTLCIDTRTNTKYWKVRRK
jgi:hypothetical protein